MLIFLITSKQKPNPTKPTNQTNKITKARRKTSGGDGYIYYLDHGDGYTSVCICPNLCTGFFSYTNYASVKLK